MSVFKTKTLQVVGPIVALTIGSFAGSVQAGDMTVSAGKLAKNAKDYYGKVVTVKAEVETVYDSRSFTLDEDSMFAGPDVLVLVPAGMTDGLMHDQMVTVTGKVRPYVTTELEKDYDWFKNGKLVTSKSEIDFDTRPVLVATSLKMADGRDMMSMSSAMPMSHDEHARHDKMKGDKMSHDHAGMQHSGSMMSAGKLSKDGKMFYGQSVTVRAEVEDVLDSHSFTLDEDSMIPGPDVIVIVPSGFDVSRLAHDQVVTVSGKVRQYVVADLEKDYHWFKDGKIVSTSDKVDYKTRPVLIAEKITTADGMTLMTQR